MYYWAGNGARIAKNRRERGGGPQCHEVVNRDKRQCWCGYWGPDGLLYSDEALTKRVNGNGMWRCSYRMCLHRVRDDNPSFCDCEPGKWRQAKSLVMLPQSLTFSYR